MMEEGQRTTAPVSWLKYPCWRPNMPRGQAGLSSFPGGLKSQSHTGLTFRQGPLSPLLFLDQFSGAVVPPSATTCKKSSREEQHLLSDMSHRAPHFKACTIFLPMSLLSSLCSLSPLLSCHGLAESTGFPRAFLSYF